MIQGYDVIFTSLNCRESYRTHVLKGIITYLTSGFLQTDTDLTMIKYIILNGTIIGIESDFAYGVILKKICSNNIISGSSQIDAMENVFRNRVLSNIRI
jgi:hypothetical protein